MPATVVIDNDEAVVEIGGFASFDCELWELLLKLAPFQGEVGWYFGGQKFDRHCRRGRCGEHREDSSVEVRINDRNRQLRLSDDLFDGA